MMKNRHYYHCRIDAENRSGDDRFISMYLQFGNFRRKNQIGDLDSGIKKRRFFLYCLAGIFVCTGLFFVLF